MTNYGTVPCVDNDNDNDNDNASVTDCLHRQQTTRLTLVLHLSLSKSMGAALNHPLHSLRVTVDYYLRTDGVLLSLCGLTSLVLDARWAALIMLKSCTLISDSCPCPTTTITNTYASYFSTIITKTVCIRPSPCISRGYREMHSPSHLPSRQHHCSPTDCTVVSALPL